MEFGIAIIATIIIIIDNIIMSSQKISNSSPYRTSCTH